MPAIASLAEEIQDLKRERNAIVLAHHYQESEIQELADSIGDSLELARKAREFDGDVIVFCGVYFMAETAKILNPEKIVVVPDADDVRHACPPRDERGDDDHEPREERGRPDSDARRLERDGRHSSTP